MKHARGMFSGPKTTMYSDHITIVGFDCLYQERKHTPDTIEKILKWRTCEDTMDIRAFLDMVVQCWNHIPDFITVAAPLYEEVKKSVSFK